MVAQAHDIQTVTSANVQGFAGHEVGRKSCSVTLCKGKTQKMRISGGTKAPGATRAQGVYKDYVMTLEVKAIKQ